MVKGLKEPMNAAGYNTHSRVKNAGHNRSKLDELRKTSQQG